MCQSGQCVGYYSKPCSNEVWPYEATKIQFQNNKYPEMFTFLRLETYPCNNFAYFA